MIRMWCSCPGQGWGCVLAVLYISIWCQLQSRRSHSRCQLTPPHDYLEQVVEHMDTSQYPPVKPSTKTSTSPKPQEQVCLLRTAVCVNYLNTGWWRRQTGFSRWQPESLEPKPQPLRVTSSRQGGAFMPTPSYDLAVGLPSFASFLTHTTIFWLVCFRRP